MAKHILSCSFGKDSIATALLALQHGEPLDELVYCEVMFSEEISGELPEHNRFIHETAIPYFEQRGIPTRVLRSEKTYLSCFYHVVTRGKTKGMLSGFPLSGRCTIQRDCKLPPIKAYQKALPPDTVQYIGIAADEPKRLARLKGIPQLVRVNGYYNVGSIFDVSMTYGNKPYPIPEIKPEQMDKAIKELERLSPVSIVYQNEGVVGYDAEQHAIVFPTAMPQCEVLARLPAEIVIATAEQCEPGIAQAPYMRKTAMAVSVEFCGRFSLPMPDTAAATLDGMDTHIPPGEERKTLEEIRELSVTIGDTVEKALGLQRGQSAPQRDEAR